MHLPAGTEAAGHQGVELVSFDLGTLGCERGGPCLTAYWWPRFLSWEWSLLALGGKHDLHFEKMFPSASPALPSLRLNESLLAKGWACVERAFDQATAWKKVGSHLPRGH